MSSSDRLTDPCTDQKTSKLIPMFPLSWATVADEWRWHEILGSEGDDGLRSRRCEADQEQRGRNIEDPSEGTITVFYMFNKS